MSYFDPLAIERSGALYRILGVRRFRPFVMGGSFWKKLLTKQTRTWTKANHKGYIVQSIYGEIGHLASFFVLLAFSAYLALQWDWVGVLGLVMLNLMVNVYPILVLRQNRTRILVRSGKKTADFIRLA